MSTKEVNPDWLESEHFFLMGRSSAAQNYADGITQLFFGFPLTKILFHTVIEPQNGATPEMRKADQYLTIQTVTAIELANLILSTAKQSEDQLLKDINENAREKIKNILSNYLAVNAVDGFQIEESSPPKKGSKSRAK